ncbi:MAG: flavin reductase family protein [Armatimonadetes bacterium]|nr:flavin reductase family protein [Armatimonadota bacterium]
MKTTDIATALAGKYPEWIVFVVTCDATGRVDLMPAGWCMVCSGEPPMLAVALGLGRHTRTVVEATGEFQIAFAGEGQREVVDFAGRCSGREVDKIAALGLRLSPGAATRVPLVEGCARSFECRLAGSLPSGDHVIYVGEILAAHVADPPVRNLVNFGGWYGPARAEE